MIKHVVIIIYILELCAAFAMFAVFKIFWSSARYRNNPDEQSRKLNKICIELFGLIVVRLVVKAIYFYIEYYIVILPVNLLLDFLMDFTYVLSLHFTFNLIEHLAGIKFRFRRLVTIIAGAIYVFGFSTVQLLWIDKSSIVDTLEIPDGIATAGYMFNEEVLAVSMLVISFMYIGWLKKHKTSVAHPKECLVLLINNIWYVLYVNLWNISYINQEMKVLRIFKPMDGLHVYILVLLILFGYTYKTEQDRIGKLQLEKDIVKENESASAPVIPEADPLEIGRTFIDKYGLTKREFEVMMLLMQGKSYQDISDDLVISLNTVKRHCSNIYQKCDVKSRSQLNTLFKM